jgi:hypothetical protein
MMADFGTCWGTPLGQDISTPSYMAKGNQCVAEAILRRWTTPRGALIDDPNYGFSVIDLVSDDLSKRDIAYAQQQLAQEAEKDERVRSASVVLSLSVAGLLSLDAAIATANGPFRLVLQVSAVTPLTLLVSP